MSVEISSSLCAGKQCITKASVLSNNLEFIWKPSKSDKRLSLVDSSPMLTHVSVYTTSASETAFCGSFVAEKEIIAEEYTEEDPNKEYTSDNVFAKLNELKESE